MDETIGTLMFLKRLDLYNTAKPYSIHVPAEAVPDGLWTNEDAEAVQVPIRNIRGDQNAFSLDENGFEVFRRPFDFEYDDYADASLVQSGYVDRVVQMLRQRFESAEVFVFDWKIRRRSPLFPSHPRGGDAKHPQPVQGVHIDFTPQTVVQLAKQHLGSQSSALLRRRCQIINTWQPLFGPLQDWPLSLCDYRSVNPEQDLVPSDQIYPNRVEEIYNVFPNERQKWLYLRDQMPEEMILFKVYDSERGVARCAPHASFEDTSVGSTEVRLRESIETRVFIFGS